MLKQVVTVLGAMMLLVVFMHLLILGQKVVTLQERIIALDAQTVELYLRVDSLMNAKQIARDTMALPKWNDELWR